MSKARVYGEQVLIELWDAKRNAPLVVEFDSFDYKMIVESEESYRTVGKSATSHSMKFGGWELTLTRQKRDNHLDELVEYLQAMSMNRRMYTQLTVQKTTKHSFSVETMDEIQEAMSQAKKINSSDNYSAEQRFEQENLVNKKKGAAILEGFAVGLADKAFGGNTGKQLLQGYEDVRNKLADILNAVDTAPLYVNPFKERIVYFDCTITAFSGNDAPKKESEQTITLKGTYLRSFTTENAFNKYINMVLTNSYLNQVTNDLVNYKNSLDDKALFQSFILDDTYTVSSNEDTSGSKVDYLTIRGKN